MRTFFYADHSIFKFPEAQKIIYSTVFEQNKLLSFAQIRLFKQVNVVKLFQWLLQP